MAAPTYPPAEELAPKLAAYVDVDLTSPSADVDYITDVTDEVIDWLTLTIAAVETVPVSAYTRAFLEVGAQLFRRRRTWGNVDALEAPATPPVYANPYRPAFHILDPYIGPVIA